MTLFSASNELPPSRAGIAPQDVTSTVRYLAGLKNVPLTPEQVSTAVAWTEKCLRDPQMPFVDLGDAPIADPMTKVVDRILDIFAAVEVMHYVVAVIEGNKSPDSAMIVKRADEAVHQFTGGVPFYCWPDPKETFRQHYRDVPWAPVVIKADDGTTSTNYMRNDVFHRDPAQGPAVHRKGLFGECLEYWVDGKRHRPHEQGPAIINTDIEGGDIVHQEFFENGVLYRPSADGPVIVQTLDGRTVIEVYQEDGELHRDPKEGPAMYCKTRDNEVWEFWVHGLLHRDSTDGPALIETNLEGRGIRREEYYQLGLLHRPSNDGPAVIGTDASGERFLEIFCEHGERHRDPKQGPARHFKDDLGEEWEYVVNGKRHRDAADGPAFIFTYANGKPVCGEEYYKEGRWHRPASEGPAILQVDPSGKRLFEIYVEDGEPHRDPKSGPAWYSVEDGIIEIRYQVRGAFHRDERDGPARTQIHEATGIVVVEDYWRHGKENRTDGPAHVSRDPVTGVTVHEEYHQDGKQHREGDSPALLIRDASTGIVTMAHYILNDRMYRDDGPAWIEWHPVTGAVTCESWVGCDGLFHRADGPAVIARDEYGRVTSEEYWVKGEKLEPPALSGSHRASRRKTKSRSRKTATRRAPLVPAEARDG